MGRSWHSAVYAGDIGLQELINAVCHSLLSSLKNNKKSAVHVLFLTCIMKQTLLYHILRYNVSIYKVKYGRSITDWCDYLHLQPVSVFVFMSCVFQCKCFADYFHNINPHNLPLAANLRCCSFLFFCVALRHPDNNMSSWRSSFYLISCCHHASLWLAQKIH